jgi:hypothetical protein
LTSSDNVQGARFTAPVPMSVNVFTISLLDASLKKPVTSALFSAICDKIKSASEPTFALKFRVAPKSLCFLIFLVR